MKKLISLLSVSIIGISSITTVVSCKSTIGFDPYNLSTWTNAEKKKIETQYLAQAKQFNPYKKVYSPTAVVQEYAKDQQTWTNWISSYRNYKKTYYLEPWCADAVNLAMNNSSPISASVYNYQIRTYNKNIIPDTNREYLSQILKQGIYLIVKIMNNALTSFSGEVQVWIQLKDKAIS